MTEPQASLEHHRPRGGRGAAGRQRDSIRFGAGAAGLERAEVHLAAGAFAPHRHDTYAIGVTTAGAQCFQYRGAPRVCLPGQLHVLHPDELHDGVPGTEAGFGYRILYVAPGLLRDALGSRPLPFVADPVQDQRPATRSVPSLLRSMDDPISDLARAEVAAAIVDALRVMSGSRFDQRSAPIDVVAVELARDYLAAHACEQTPAATLEVVTGADRYTLARHFRRAFGTSPDRYRTMRRLELARSEMSQGRSLAEVAARTGFADQSHLTRQFKRAFGMTPSRWLAVTTTPGPNTR